MNLTRRRISVGLLVWRDTGCRAGSRRRSGRGYISDESAIAEAGWASQEASGLLAVLGPRLVGVPTNCIPAYLKRLAGRRFRKWQAEVDAERAARRGHRHLRLVIDNTHTDHSQPPTAEPSPARGDQARAA